MITLSLSAPLFGLFTALLFAATELLLLSSLLNLINLHVCRHLRHDPPLPPLSIRGYRFRVFLATLFSIFLFLLLELLLSLTSDPSTRPIRSSARCQRSFIPRLPGTANASDPGSEALHFVCTKVDNITISHAPGNRTLGRVRGVDFPECEAESAYVYKIGERVTQTPDIAPLFYGCSFRMCGAAAWLPDADNPRTGTAYLSGPVPVNQTGMKMIPTRILRDGDRLTGQEQALADGLVRMLESGSTEEGEIRRHVFTGISEDTCMFKVAEKDVTEVQTWAIWTAGVVWAVTVVVALAGVCGRRRVFFDMGNAEHWAARARHGEARAEVNRQPAGMGVQRGGDGVVWIVGMRNQGDGALARATGSWGAARRNRMRTDEQLEGDYAG